MCGALWNIPLCWSGESLLGKAQCMVFSLVSCNACVSLLFLGDRVSIGDVSYKLKTPKSPELVPQNYSKKVIYL